MFVFILLSLEYEYAAILNQMLSAAIVNEPIRMNAAAVAAAAFMFQIQTSWLKHKDKSMILSIYFE